MPEIIIKDWHKGIASSPHFGFDEIRNASLADEPGALLAGLASRKESSTTVTAIPKWIVKNPLSEDEVFALDSAGAVYTSTNNGDSWAVVAGNTVTSAHGNGLAIWKDYLIVARDFVLDTYGPLSSAPAWTNGWKTIGTSAPDDGGDPLFHPMLHGQDDILYIGCGRYLASVAEAVAPFVPGTAASFTFTAQALDIPAGNRIKCLSELGKHLLLGTWRGTTVGKFTTADIYPWDRVSSSYNLPIRVNESGVHQMISAANLVYFQAGVKGNLFVTNGTTVERVADLSRFYSFTELSNSFPGAICTHGDKILWATSAGSGGPMGVWCLQQGVLSFDASVSTGTTTSVQVASLLPVSSSAYLIGWLDGSAKGIDSVNLSGTARRTSYGTYVDSQFYVVGGPTRKASFSELELQFTQPLTSGDGVKISYRNDLAASFTLMATVDFATYGAIESFRGDASIADEERLQFRIELTTGGGDTTPHLLTVTIR